MFPEIQYHPSPDQRAIVAELETAIAEILPVSRLHKQRHESSSTWDALEDLGIFDLAVEEALGGAGLGAVEEALLAAALGRQLASPSVFAKCGSAHAATRVEGRTAVAFTSRNGITLVREPDADVVLFRSGDKSALYAINGEGTAFDGNPWLDEMGPCSGLGPKISKFDADGLTRLRLIDAAALAGLAGAALEMAVNYAQVREQFGRPIGTFQAIKHHCANMAVAARQAIDIVTFAATAFDHGREDVDFLVESAFLTATEAALENSGKNIQIHGGIGFSDESNAHLFLKRANALIAIGGGTEAAVRRLEKLAVTVGAKRAPANPRRRIHAGSDSHRCW